MGHRPKAAASFTPGYSAENSIPPAYFAVYSVLKHIKNMRRTAISFVAACLLFACAAGFGWHEYMANPSGVLLYTPNGPCPPLAHRFSVGLTLALLLAAAASLFIAILCLLASFIPCWSVRGVREVSFIAMLVVPFLGVFWLSHPLFESFLPLQPVPGCEYAAP